MKNLKKTGEICWEKESSENNFVLNVYFVKPFFVLHLQILIGFLLSNVPKCNSEHAWIVTQNGTIIHMHAVFYNEVLWKSV